MKLFLTVPYDNEIDPTIVAFKDAAQALFRARGWSMRFEPVRDRPTMACRNAQVNRFLSTPYDTFLTLDHDCIPTMHGKPDMAGLMHLIEDIQRDDIDVVGGWTLIHMEGHDPELVPCVVDAYRAEDGEHPINFVAPYSGEPLHEFKGGGIGSHCLMVKRCVFESMRNAGRLYFDDIHDRDPQSKTFGSRILGHDLAFSRLAQDMGFRVWLDNRVFWGHRKPVDLRWVHDLVRDLTRRIDAHASVALAADPHVPAWMTLREAEERHEGRTVWMGHTGALSAEVMHAAVLGVIDGWGMDVVIVEDVTMLVGMDTAKVLSVERVGAGAVVRCVPNPLGSFSEQVNDHLDRIESERAR